MRLCLYSNLHLQNPEHSTLNTIGESWVHAAFFKPTQTPYVFYLGSQRFVDSDYSSHSCRVLSRKQNIAQWIRNVC